MLDGRTSGRTSVPLELDGPNKLLIAVGMDVSPPRSTDTLGTVDGAIKGETDGTLVVGSRLDGATGGSLGRIEGA
jgi:hypothetical protein